MVPSGELAGEGRAGWRAMRSALVREPGQALGLAAITVLSIALAISLVDQPIRCDEAGTYLNFVRHGIRKILTDYSTPNNHILHSVAAKVATKLFGHELWALRLPAMVFGAALAAGSYWMVRVHFGRQAALLGAAWIATCPYLVDQATNARGYTMVHLAFVVLFALAVRLLAGVGRRTAVVFAAVAAAGCWAVPVMGFPIAIVLVWLAIGGAWDLERREWGGLARRVSGVVLGTAVLVGLCYAPTLLGSGGAHPFEDGGRYDLGQREEPLDMTLRFTQWLTVVWGYATHGLPMPLAFATIGLAAVSAFAGRRGFGLRFFLANAIGVYVLLHVLGQRPPLWSLSFLVPVYWTAVAVGTATLVRLALGRRPGMERAVLTGLVVGVCALNAGLVARMGDRIWSVPWYFGYFDAEEAGHYVEAELPEREPLVGLGREMITLIYYQEMRGVKESGNYGRESVLEARTAYLIDAGFPRTEKLRQELRDAGYAEREVVHELAHSTLTRFERVE